MEKKTMDKAALKKQGTDSVRYLAYRMMLMLRRVFTGFLAFVFILILVNCMIEGGFFSFVGAVLAFVALAAIYALYDRILMKLKPDDEEVYLEI